VKSQQQTMLADAKSSLSTHMRLWSWIPWMPAAVDHVTLLLSQTTAIPIDW